MLRKTGYERTGFNGVEIFHDGIRILGTEWTDYAKGEKEYTPEEIADNDKQVLLATDWLKKYAQPIDHIYTHSSSYGLKHIIERQVGEYISNGATIEAAISEGYEYIVERNGPNVYFNLKISYKDYELDLDSNDQPLNEYGDLMDQEDYNDEIKYIVSQEYSDKCSKEWIVLSKRLLFGWGYQTWLDLGWDAILNNPSEYHPFWRIIMYNIITVIRTIYLHGVGGMGYLNDYAYGELAMSMITDIPRSYKGMKPILKDNPKIYTLYETLPSQFKYSNTFNTRYIGLTLPKAKRLVDYMFSPNFSRTMRGFVKLFREIKLETASEIRSGVS